MSSAKPIVVTVTDDALGTIQAVADELTAAGMTVDQVLPVTGVITGACAPGQMAALRKVKGVHSVEDEGSVQLPPPDSGVQ